MYKRHIQQEIEAYLKIMPVTLITGARQTGKTTLVEWIASQDGFTYYTFDDEMSLSNARRDPAGWLASLQKPAIIDEVQRMPELFLSIKRDVDQHRQPGRYLLTGSANPLLLTKLGDSLAGRMGIVTLFPFSVGELNRTIEDFIPYIFSPTMPLRKYPQLTQASLFEKILRGGFPTVQTFSNLQDVNRWVRSYLQTMMERDVRDIANIEGLKEFPRLFRLLATRSGTLLNISDLSRSLGMVHMTLNRYLRLLEALYFIHLLPAWYTNLGKRLIKSPKLQICDTAVQAQLLEIDESRLKQDPVLAGQLLENFVFSELQKQRSWSSIPIELYHFRDGDLEVDFVLERSDGTIIGIEVKSAKSLHTNDLKGLRHLKKVAKGKFKRGIILHLGHQTESLGEDLWALPIQSLWEN